ncbi:hypothetical protein ACQP1O_21695 [Nocardia sp. CA-151230]|uniref:hypothetical protein n=1 Tax=Nocardia sp. CA-151230 TaxID=3239982 RepID=UPI003D8C4CE3
MRPQGEGPPEDGPGDPVRGEAGRGEWCSTATASRGGAAAKGIMTVTVPLGEPPAAVKTVEVKIAE